MNTQRKEKFLNSKKDPNLIEKNKKDLANVEDIEFIDDLGMDLDDILLHDRKRSLSFKTSKFNNVISSILSIKLNGIKLFNKNQYKDAADCFKKVSIKN